jgi:hypothetical protein
MLSLVVMDSYTYFDILEESTSPVPIPEQYVGQLW